jgi:hypothetical protein
MKPVTFGRRPVNLVRADRKRLLDLESASASAMRLSERNWIRATHDRNWGHVEQQFHGSILRRSSWHDGSNMAETISFGGSAPNMSKAVLTSRSIRAFSW